MGLLLVLAPHPGCRPRWFCKTAGARSSLGEGCGVGFEGRLALRQTVSSEEIVFEAQRRTGPADSSAVERKTSSVTHQVGFAKGRRIPWGQYRGGTKYRRPARECPRVFWPFGRQSKQQAHHEPACRYLSGTPRTARGDVPGAAPPVAPRSAFGRAEALKGVMHPKRRRFVSGVL